MAHTQIYHCPWLLAALLWRGVESWSATASGVFQLKPLKVIIGEGSMIHGYRQCWQPSITARGIVTEFQVAVALPVASATTA